MKILIVDDSKLYQKTVEKNLKPFFPEAQFFTASDGEEGYQKFLEIQPDVMTIDLLMPKMNGVELVTKIQEGEHTTKLLVLSADVQKLVQDEIASLGATFFSKPLNEEKTQEMVKTIKG